MMNIGLMKGNSIKSNEIFFDVGQSGYGSVFVSTTADGITVYDRLNVSHYFVRAGIKNEILWAGNDGAAGGTVRIKFNNPNAITSATFNFLSNNFPDLSILTSLTTLGVVWFDNISFDNPYLYTLGVRLKAFNAARGLDISNLSTQTFLGSLKVNSLSFSQIYGTHNRLNYATFLPNLAPTLTYFLCWQFYGQLIPDCTSLVNLVTANFNGLARIADGGISGDCIDYLPNTNKLKTIIFSNGNATLTNIDILVNKIYTWANTNSNNSVTLSIGGNNASPTGTYDGTTDWSGGLPTSPKAKLWHLVNSRSWIITYTP